MVDVSEEGSVNIHSKKQHEEDIPSAHFFSFENEIALYKGESTSLARRVTLPSGTNALEDSELANKCCLPPFRRADSAQWFIQVEKFFNVYGVRSDFLRYNMVICKLDSKTIQEIGNVLRSPPASNKYDKLKNAIIRRLSHCVDNNPDSVDFQLNEECTQFKLEDNKLTRTIDEMCFLTDTRVPEYIIDRSFNNIEQVKVRHEQPSTSSATFSSNHRKTTAFHPNLTSREQYLIQLQNRSRNKFQNSSQNSQQVCLLNRSLNSMQSKQPGRRLNQSQNLSQNIQQDWLLNKPLCHQKDSSQYCLRDQISDKTLHKDLDTKHVEEQTQQFATANNNEPGNEVNQNLNEPSRVKRFKRDIFIRLKKLKIFNKLINKKKK